MPAFSILHTMHINGLLNKRIENGPGDTQKQRNEGQSYARG